MFSAAIPGSVDTARVFDAWGMLMEKEAYASGAITSGLLDWSTPVSYTHLDVYKRQVYDR